MSKNQKNSKSIVLQHSLGVFLLLLIWGLLFVFKPLLGRLTIVLFVLLAIVTIISLYLLNKSLLKGLTNNEKGKENDKL